MPFTATTRMSGLDVDGRQIRKGAADSVRQWVIEQGGTAPDGLGEIVDRIARAGSTPLVVAEDADILGVIELKDVVKAGIKERFAELRASGIRTVMITGDNPLTAAAIAQEAGVDDFLAEATPEAKMELIKAEQQGGKLVAMTGDGTNDAPALAQADVGVAMNTGTTAAKEAGNMVDLDSNPTKLIDVVEIGKQLLITRGSLTTVLHRQRRGQVLRHHPGALRDYLSADQVPQHLAPAQRAECGALGRDLQRPGHSRPYPPRPARCEVAPVGSGVDPAPQRLYLRDRGRHRPLHLHQAD